MVAVVNIGSSTTVTGGAVTITVGAGGVPSGAHIIVVASWNLTVVQPTITDSASNSYLISGSGSAQSNNNNPSNGAGAIYRSRTGGALANGNTIVVTLGGIATAAAVDAFYATGLQAVTADSTSYNVSFGSSTTPSVTSGIPVAQGELFVAMVTGATTISSFTQDTTNASWGTSPPAGSISNTAPVLGVGFVVNTGLGTLTYAPTFGTSDAWAATIIGYPPDTAAQFQPDLAIDDPPIWVGSPVKSAPIGLLTSQKEFGQGGQAPPFRPNFSLNDPPEWQGKPAAYSLAQLLSGTVVRPPATTPNPSRDDVFVWQPQASFNVLSGVTQNPFHNAKTYWYHEGSDWQGSPVNAKSISLTTTQVKVYGQPGQSPPFRWNATLDDAPAAQPNLPRNQNLLSSSAQTPFSPVIWGTVIDPSHWQGSPVNAKAVALTTTQVKFYGQPGQAPPFRWNATLDDPPSWWPANERNIGLLTTIITEPFSNTWVTVYPADYTLNFPPEWVGAPQHSAIIPALTAMTLFSAGGQVLPYRWNATLDDPPSWQRQPQRSNAVSLLTVGGQPPTKTWRYDYDDSSTWWPATERDTKLITTAVAMPFSNIWSTVYPVDFTRNDPPEWVGSPRGSAVIPALTAVNLFGAGGQAPPFRWNATIDDSSTWQPHWFYNSNLTPPSNNTPAVPLVRQTVIDDAFWQGSPMAALSNFLPLTIIVAPITAPRPPYEALWSPTVTYNLGLNPPAPIVTLPFFNAYWWLSDDPPPWQFRQPFDLALAASVFYPSVPIWEWSASEDYTLPLPTTRLNSNPNIFAPPPARTSPLVNPPTYWYDVAPTWPVRWPQITINIELFPPPPPRTTPLVTPPIYWYDEAPSWPGPFGNISIELLMLPPPSSLDARFVTSGQPRTQVTWGQSLIIVKY
jgi:hypothetical protein